MTTPDAIARLASKIALTPAAHMLRTRILSRQRTLILKLWPTATAVAVGSFAQGTSLQGGDLDIAFCVSGQEEPPESVRWAKQLHHLNFSSGLAQSSGCDDARIVGIRSPVPVLRYQTTVDEVEGEAVFVDVSCQPIAPMQLRDDFVVMALDHFRGAREALMVMKAWQVANGFDKPRTGGFGSYALALALIACLNAARLRGEVPKTPWAIVREYLSFYSDLRFTMFHGVLNPASGTIPVVEPQTKYLRLEDPAIPGHIVGKKAFNMLVIVEEMRKVMGELDKAGPEMSLEEAERIFTENKVHPMPVNWSPNVRRVNLFKPVEPTAEVKELLAAKPSEGKPDTSADLELSVADAVTAAAAADAAAIVAAAATAR